MSVIRSNAIRTACAALTGLTIVAMPLAEPADAGNRDRSSTLVAPEGQPIEKRRVPFQKSVQANCSSSICITQFAQVAKNQQLHIQNVACYAILESPGEAPYFLIGDAAQTLTGATAPMVVSSTAMDIFAPPPNVSTHHVVNVNTRFIGKQGAKLGLYTVAEDNIEFIACKFAGETALLK